MPPNAQILYLTRCSGSTLIAAEKTGRRGHAMEIDPLYIDVAVRRWQRYSGKPARLDGSGATFEDIAEQRRTSTPARIVADCSMKQQNG